MKFVTYFKNLIKFFAVLFKMQSHNRKVAKATGHTIKRTGAKLENVKKYTNAEKLYDWLRSKGYTKYVHPRGEYAEIKEGKEITATPYRLYIMNQRRLRLEAAEKNKVIVRADKPNKWGHRQILELI